MGDGEVVGISMSRYQTQYYLEVAQESIFLLGRLTTVFLGSSEWSLPHGTSYEVKWASIIVVGFYLPTSRTTAAMWFTFAEGSFI